MLMHETDDQTGRCELARFHLHAPCFDVETFDVELEVDQTDVDGEVMFIRKRGRDEEQQHLVSTPMKQIVSLTVDEIEKHGVDLTLGKFAIETIDSAESNRQCITNEVE